MVFVIDLPRLEANGARATTVFAENVANFLKASGVEDAMVKSLGNYDFSATENLGFVCSMSVAVIARFVLFCRTNTGQTWRPRRGCSPSRW